MANARATTSLMASGVAAQARPVSPTFSQTTEASSVANFEGGPQRVITKKGLRASLQAYEDLITASTAYRKALCTISQASAGFASAVERCSRLKGVSDDSGGGFLAAGGLHHLIANQEQVLSDCFLKKFEVPLSQNLDQYRRKVTERTVAYEKSQTELSRRIRQTEAENVRVGRRKQRDLQSFRAALSALQAQVEELDLLKANYYTDVLEAEEETWDFVLSKVSHVVRSSLDVYERIASKATDPSLEPLLTAIPDPFDSYGPPQGDDKIFSILTPIGMATATLGNSLPKTEEPRVVTPTGHDRVRSWMDTEHSQGRPEEPDAVEPHPVTPTQRNFDIRHRAVLSSIEETRFVESSGPTSPLRSDNENGQMDGSKSSRDAGQTDSNSERPVNGRTQASADETSYFPWILGSKKPDSQNISAPSLGSAG